MKLNRIYLEDCFQGMARLEPGSVDLILTDPPQGITNNAWDKRLHLPALWQHFHRVIKDNGAIIVFGNGMFTADLMRSNTANWRYNLVWEKNQPTGFLNAHRMPLRAHEDICVFYKRLPVYHPQKTTGHLPVHSYTKRTGDGTNYGMTALGISGGGSTERYPRSVLRFPNDRQRGSFHPTQKPVQLVEYLILTYTDEGDLALDPFMGSGTTAVACIKAHRCFIGFETHRPYWEQSQARLKEESD